MYKTPMRGMLVIVAVALTLVSLAPGVRADSNDEAARIHFQSGTRYYERGDYEDAVREFRAAYELSGRPQLLYNLYLAHERLGHYREAAQALGGYLEQAPEVEDRERLEHRLENLRRRVAAMDEEEAAGSPAASTATRERAMPMPALASFAAAGGGLVIFAVSGALVLAEDGALADRCGANAGRLCTDADLEGLRRRTIAADVGLAVTAAGLVTGLVLHFVLRDREHAAVTAKVRATPSGLSIAF